MKLAKTQLPLPGVAYDPTFKKRIQFCEVVLHFLEVLESRFHTLDYLLLIFRNYLKDHGLLYETRKGQRNLNSHEFPDESDLVGYADDVAY